MNVLVSAASKYGATTEIAGAIARALADAGVDVTVLPPEHVLSIDEYDALVLGSAVYAGHWMTSARELVDRHTPAFAGRRVWLFSSGPVGEPPIPKGEAVDVSEVLRATGAVEHKLFAGRLQKQRLNFAEKAMVFALRVPEGDYRNWDEIADWARHIAESMAL